MDGTTMSINLKPAADAIIQRSLFDRAMATSNTLKRISSELNEQLLAAERILRDLDLGVSASVPIGDAQKLCWQGHRGDWQLVVTQGALKFTLYECSRKVCCSAAMVLPDLLEALLVEVEPLTRDVSTAVTTIRQLVAAIKKSQ